ncbi:phospholipid-translocating ATPase [Strigomonas culicis]|uniref:Phospholipid-transporting ATPase n=1 Tax=Strigomonas culicis TaxID=28005 RepID=S9W8Q6_9TRYP|nr:phospholipid-translocating ATPase [Strigomonas culicis]|eukprot:EPY32220.1 phospholipid-translocating ATPase [Strigomonas culicis]
MKNNTDTEEEMSRVPYISSSTYEEQQRSKKPHEELEARRAAAATHRTATATAQSGDAPPRSRGQYVLEMPPTKKKRFGTFFHEWLNLSMKLDDAERVIALGVSQEDWNGDGFPGNAINNRRYSFLTFLPLNLIHQFANFFNLFYLCLAFSQLIPSLKVGFLFTYFSPLCMVVLLSLCKDAVDEVKRYRRDRQANNEKFDKIVSKRGRVESVRADEIKVGDLLLLHHNQRIPADCILLHTSEQNGNTFIRTDQLDGETDWKLRFPLNLTKHMTHAQIAQARFNIHCEPLHKDIYKFVGVADSPDGGSEAINLENTLWSSCAVASGTLMVVVIHTGTDTRSAMNSARPVQKKGLIDHELDYIGLLCFLLLIIMSILLVVQQRFVGNWAINFIRFFILMSAMIPISMRVNVDVGRLWYSHEIGTDKKIPGTVARNTDMPEELGRLQYLFCDKTGTLTKNIMEFRAVRVAGNLAFTDRDAAQLTRTLALYFQELYGAPAEPSAALREADALGQMFVAMIVCHNVNLIVEEGAAAVTSYQASSPDEVAIVNFCKQIGLVLTERDVSHIVFTEPGGRACRYEVIKNFPFTSERKAMGILVRQSDEHGKEHFYYYMKGADTKMLTVIRPTGWVSEAVQEVAQMCLRTLVFAVRPLSKELLDTFLQRYEEAATIMGDLRQVRVQEAMDVLERDMTPVGVSGVEDELQDDVVVTLETLRMCGIKRWVLTGDKVETAVTIARSTRLLERNGDEELLLCTTLEDTHSALNRLLYHTSAHMNDPAYAYDLMLTVGWSLIMDGTTLSFCLHPMLEELFTLVARDANAVVIARCSPTQKAAVVKAMRRHIHKSVCMAAIGDGGNDVAMILEANVGIGIEGVEGKQASMAADFSITQFSHCTRLIMWHGRNAYRRTCRLSQFIMHRGIVYSVVQAGFSILFAGTTMSVFNGYLLMGYSTIFTMAPAFALVLDQDFKESDMHEFPHLYKELVKGRSMNMRTFLEWVWMSFFQGGVMLYVALEIFSNEMFQMVTTCLHLPPPSRSSSLSAAPRIWAFCGSSAGCTFGFTSARRCFPWPSSL